VGTPLIQSPFGSILKLNLTPARSWLSLGPGWAAIAGALAAGQFGFTLAALLPLVSLWLLVDPLLGMLWELTVTQELWRSLLPQQWPVPSRRGFFVPYAQPKSPAGRLSLRLRRYRRWWDDTFWPEHGAQLAAVGLGLALALLLSYTLSPTLFRLTLLALGLTLLAGLTPTHLTMPEGGRLQSVVQLLLPWVMGVTLAGSSLTLPELALAVCYWVTYLGGLRWLGGHARANWLFWAGQMAALTLLLTLQMLPGAALLGVLLAAQALIQTKFNHPADFLAKAQPYLVLSVLIAGGAFGAS
jgi:hypothetical protein